MASKAVFDELAFSEFLKSGWCLGLGSNAIAVGWGHQTHSETAPEDSNFGAFFAPDFYLESPTPWRVTPHWALIDRSLFASYVLAKLGREVNADLNSEVQRLQWVEPTFEGFETQVASIRQGFAARGLEKAVPVVHAEVREIPNITQLLRFLRHLSQTPSSLIPYGFWSEVGGMIGATPEILFSNRIGRSEGRPRKIDTMALAGTRAKSPGAADLLLNDKKERHEHQLVVNDIQKVLTKLGAVSVSDIEVAELPTLLHLKTPISVEVKHRVSFSELAQALHPTPALGVSPRSLGFAEIRRWDDVQKRGRYGAPMGVSLRDEKGQEVHECLVAIRGIQWHDGVMRLSSGCGFVKESDPTREWAELKLKRDSVKRILGV